MNRLEPLDFAAFTRRYRLPGGRLRRVRVKIAGAAIDLEFTMSARTVPKDLGVEPRRVTLRFHLRGVEEYRLQKRPGQAAGAVPEARFGTFQGLVFLTFDAYTLGPGEQPQLYDFRASECYAGARELWWEEVKPKPKS